LIIMTTLQRAATRQPGPGDLTGARALSASQAAADRQEIIDHSSRMLNDPDVPLAIVDVPGGSPFALPRYVLDAIRRAAK